MRRLCNSIAQNYNNGFWWYLAKIFKRLYNGICMFQFSCRFAFLSTFRLSNWTPKITSFWCSRYASTLIRWNFLNMTFVTHKHTCRHLNIIHSSINQFYLINIRPTASPKVTKSTRHCLLTVDCRNAERAECRMFFSGGMPNDGGPNADFLNF